MSSVGFEPTIPAGERPQTYALDRATTGTGNSNPRDNNVIEIFSDLVVVLSVGPLLPFEDFTSILVSPG